MCMYVCVRTNTIAINVEWWNVNAKQTRAILYKSKQTIQPWPKAHRWLRCITNTRSTVAGCRITNEKQNSIDSLFMNGIYSFEYFLSLFIHLNDDSFFFSFLRFFKWMKTAHKCHTIWINNEYAIAPDPFGFSSLRTCSWIYLSILFFFIIDDSFM